MFFYENLVLVKWEDLALVNLNTLGFHLNKRLWKSKNGHCSLILRTFNKWFQETFTKNYQTFAVTPLFPQKKPTYTNKIAQPFRADIVIFDTRIAEKGPSGSWPFPPEIGDTETLKKSPEPAERMASLIETANFFSDFLILVIQDPDAKLILETAWPKLSFGIGLARVKAGLHFRKPR